MKRLFFFLMLVALPVMGQAAMLDSKPSIQSENLAPMKVTNAVSADAGLVSGISVTLPETDGFARDTALTEAARKGLPVALGQLETPVPADKAVAIAKSVGEPMQFVKSYRIIKEVLVPTYSLTVDMVYDAQKLKANFGRVETTVATSSTEVSGSWSTGPAEVAATVGTPTTLKVEAKTAAQQDKLFNTLSKAGMKPVWRLLTRDGGEMVVFSTLDTEALRAKIEALGFGAEVSGADLVVRAE